MQGEVHTRLHTRPGLHESPLGATQGRVQVRLLILHRADGGCPRGRAFPSIDG